MVGAAGVLLAAAFEEPAHATRRAAASLRRARFDPRLARHLPDLTVAAALNWGPGKDPSLLLLPAIQAIAAAHR